MSTTNFGLRQIGQIAITVHDLDRAVEFYREVLGMNFLFKVPNMAFFDCGGIRLMLGIPSSPEFDHPASIIYYKVEDLQAAYAQLALRGVEFSAAPQLIAKLPDHELWMAFCKDVDGNTLALMSEVRNS
jgi:methylmalonyl-CoA/ethylmalonyl-CoA epimerase